MPRAGHASAAPQSPTGGAFAFHNPKDTPVTDAVKELWRTLANVAPKVALFAAILAVGYLAALLVKRIVTNLLLRAGFNRLVDKAGLNRILGRTEGTELVGKLTYLAVILLVLQLAFGVFGPNPVSSLITSVIAFLPRLAVAIALVVVAGVIANTVRNLIEAAIGALSYARTIATAASGAIIALGVIAALAQMGVALAVTMPVLIAALTAAAGILIVGVGGGLIKPMEARWENYLTKAESEAATLTTEPLIEPEAEPELDPTVAVVVRRGKK